MIQSFSWLVLPLGVVLSPPRGLVFSPGGTCVRVGFTASNELLEGGTLVGKALSSGGISQPKTTAFSFT